MRFVWIDDNPDRKVNADNMAQQLGIAVEFINANKTSIDGLLVKLVNNQPPDLVIMDHSLDTVISDTYRKGSTAAVFIHEHWPSCPIISFTGVPLNEIDIRHQSIYEGVYPINKISENYSAVLAVAAGMKTINDTRIKDLSTIISLFNAPQVDLSRLATVMPASLKNNFDDSSLGLEVLRWTLFTLFDRPGFLYNQLWASTYLGLNEEGFEQVETKFEKARYKGVFSNDDKPLWWRSSLTQIVSEIVGKTGVPWIVGQELVEVKTNLLATCYSSGERYPETVAAVDTTEDAPWYPMKLKNTDPHPFYPNLPFFEELRIMKQGNGDS